MVVLVKGSHHLNFFCIRFMNLPINVVFIAVTLIWHLKSASPFAILYHTNNRLNVFRRPNVKEVIVLPPTCPTSMKVTSILTWKRKSCAESYLPVRCTIRDAESPKLAYHNNTQLSEFPNDHDDAVPLLTMEDDSNEYNDDIYARSMFGTKEYWDNLYIGRGDFPADMYSWYTNWNELQHYINHYTTAASMTAVSQIQRGTAKTRSQCIFIPGIGNDSLLIDMIRAGYNQHHTLVVQDYSYHAIERQIELLQSIGCSNYQVFRGNDDVENDDVAVVVATKMENTKRIDLYCCDITKKLPLTWNHSFDVIIEKGLFDAVYLSDDTNKNILDATRNIHQTLPTNGILISISNVIPTELRHTCFPSNNTDHNAPSWEWIRDGSTDANKAGCFILRKIQ